MLYKKNAVRIFPFALLVCAKKPNVFVILVSYLRFKLGTSGKGISGEKIWRHYQSEKYRTLFVIKSVHVHITPLNHIQVTQTINNK